jgi:hypothetical protein
VLSFVGYGGFDPVSGVMVYYYPNNDEIDGPLPSAPNLCSTLEHPLCRNYYLQGLSRQHTNSSAFNDFSPITGRAILVNLPGFYVACVSASGRDASSVLQDGVISVLYSKKDTRETQSCPS